MSDARGPEGRGGAAREVLAALAGHEEARGALVVRGGLLTAALIAPLPRPTEDVDLVATVGMARARELVRACLPGADGGEVIFEETAFPGLRYRVATGAGPVQVDIGFGDPLVPGPEERELLGVRVRTARAETLIAWKLHGLFERHDGGWRCKDLHDLWLLLRHARWARNDLGPAISASFASRDAPLWVTDRMMAEVFGGSTPSRRKWRSFARLHPDREVPGDLRQVVRETAELLRPHVGPLRALEADPPLFPVIEDVEEVVRVAASEPGVVMHRHPGLRVFSYERSSGFPLPEGAVTRAEHRRRSVLHECRGLAFDDAGRPVSRKLHRFYGLRAGEAMPAGPLLAVEKLDGTLVATASTPSGPVLHTRRGPSTLAEAATEHAARGGAAALVEEQVSLGRTVVFEWCAASHRIVFRHPRDRLVLLAVRELRTGTYLPWDELVELARRHGVERAPDRGTIVDVPGFVAEVAAAREGEGWVLRDEVGRMYKVKTDRYRLLHAVREGPDHARAALRLLLAGEREVLLDLLDDRPRTGWVEAAEEALARVEERVAATARTDRHRVRELEVDGVIRRAVYRVLDGRDDAVRTTLLEALGRSGGVELVGAAIGELPPFPTLVG